MSENLVTIASFSQTIQADLARSKLESEGIECVLADDYTVSVNWLYSNAIGGVKLRVRESDAREALALLGQESPDVADSEPDAIHCPQCGSTDVEFEKYRRRFAFASWLLLGFPIPFLKRAWKCKKCGHQWKAQASG
jgi:DNA-directed RNA polymerase subunit M/transcription elongation factor TFIIS